MAGRVQRTVQRGGGWRKVKPYPSWLHEAIDRTWFRHPLSLRFETGQTKLFRSKMDHKITHRGRVGAIFYWNFDLGWHAHWRHFTGIEIYYGRVRRFYGLKDSN